MWLIKLLLMIGNTWLQLRLVMMVGVLPIIWVTGVSVSRSREPILNTRGGLLTRVTILSSGAANIAGHWVLRCLGVSLGMVIGVCRVCCVALYWITLWVTLKISLWVTE